MPYEYESESSTCIALTALQTEAAFHIDIGPAQCILTCTMYMYITSTLQVLHWLNGRLSPFR